MVQRSEARSSGGAKAPDRLYEGYVFDLDGTIYLGDELLPGAKRLILKLRELGKRVIFLSNNPTKDPRMYAEKLGRLGLKTPESEIVNTVVTMTRWLLREHPEATVFPISEEPLKNSLSEAGIRMSENPEEIDIVIASYDRTFEARRDTLGWPLSREEHSNDRRSVPPWHRLRNGRSEGRHFRPRRDAASL